MSIFKRFSSKKSGDKGLESDSPLLDETASLTDDSLEKNIPVSADDAVPSLKGFTAKEQEVIRSILSDEKPAKSNFHKTNRKTDKDPKKSTAKKTTSPKAEKKKPVKKAAEPVKKAKKKAPVAAKPEPKKSKPKNAKKAADDYLSDESFKTALNILKGDLDIDTEFDDEELFLDTVIEPETEAKNTEAENSVSTTTNKSASRETENTVKIDYPDRLTATATFTPVARDKKVEKAEKHNPEVEIEVESASMSPLASEDEDMTSRNDRDRGQDDMGDLRRQADNRREELANSDRRINLGEMRMDVANIVSDIESGDSMYRRAQQRVENLTGFIERAEVDFSILDRLEPENRALKSENMALQSELEKRKTKISQLTNSIEDLQRRFGDTQSELDATQGNLAQSIKNNERAERDIAEMQAQMQEVRLKTDRMRNDLDVETRENSSLRGRIADLTTQLDQVTTEKLNFAKHIETLKIDVADHSENRLQLRDEVSELRHSLKEAQRQNTQMRGEITGVHDDIRGFKTQYEFNILKRDERISDLEAQIVELNDKLRVKEDHFQSTNRELSVLRKERTTQDLERERLEKSVEQANSQLYRTEEELLKSRKAADELDMKYRDVADALSRAEERRQSSVPVASPDIAPPPFHQPARAIETDDISITSQAPRVRSSAAADPIARAEPPVQEDTAPSAERIAPTRQISDDIEDMLTDYKLGLRNIG